MLIRILSGSGSNVAYTEVRITGYILIVGFIYLVESSAVFQVNVNTFGRNIKINNIRIINERTIQPGVSRRFQSSVSNTRGQTHTADMFVTILQKNKQNENSKR